MKFKTITLTQNYRSNQGIIDVANNCMDRDPPLKANKEEKNSVFVKGFKTAKQEGKFIANEITKLLKKGVPLTEIAVLSRTNKMLLDMESELTKKKIPYEFQKRDNFWEYSDCQLVIAWLTLISDPRSASAFNTVSTVIPGMGQKRCDMVIDYMSANQCDIITALISLRNKLKSVNSIDQFADYLNGQISAYKHKFMSFRDLIDDLNHQSVGRWFTNKYLKDATNIENLRCTCDDCDDLESLAERLYFKEENGGPDKLTLATIHGSKGLEYDYVFYIGCETGNAPFLVYNDQDDFNQWLVDNDNPFEPRGVDNEYKLSYVALTRARIKTWLTYTTFREGHPIYINGKWINKEKNNGKPFSPFLNKRLQLKHKTDERIMRWSKLF